MTKSPINPLTSEKCTEKRTPLVRPDVKRMTYDHQSGRDLRVKTRVWTFSPQIDEFGGRSAYYFNAAPIFCALWSPDLDLCVLLCLSHSCHATQLAHLSHILQFHFPVIKTPDVARGTSHHVQVFT